MLEVQIEFDDTFFVMGLRLFDWRWMASHGFAGQGFLMAETGLVMESLIYPHKRKLAILFVLMHTECRLLFEKINSF